MARILVVDDDMAIRKLVRHILEEAGYVTSSASNGRAGVICATEQQPDLIITDIMMPDMDGLEAILTLKSTMPKVRIIAMSAESEDAQQSLRLSRAFKAGACATLCKPFSKRKLLDIVDFALKSEDKTRVA